MKKLIITKMPVNNTQMTVSAHCDDFKLKQIEFNRNIEYRIGNIYVGKVKKIVKNIQAAFVEIGKNKECYLALSDLKHAIFLNKTSENKPLCAGDELLVQIIKEPIKTKEAVVTTNLSFTGKYIVLTTENRSIGISKKIDAEYALKLKQFIHEKREKNDNFKYGVIVRTNAKTATLEQINAEFVALIKKADQVIQNGIHRTCYSKIYEPSEEYLLSIQNSYINAIGEIVTDDVSLYEQIRAYLELYQKEDLNKLRFYDDKMLPLYKLYSLSNQLENALKKNVWLKSGGYIIIEQTEAMVVIDVNTGKFDGKKKDREQNFLKINIEAAKEIANQLILRNLSGMILIDFISMEKKESIDRLISVLIEELKKDPVKADFVDITKLGIIELTRKKTKQSLAEIISNIN